MRPSAKMPIPIQYCEAPNFVHITGDLNSAFVTTRLWALLGVVPSCVLGMVPASSGILVLFYFNCNKTKFLSFKNEACVKNTRSHNLRPQHPNPAFVTIRLWALLVVVPSCVLGMVPASSGILVLFYFNCNKTKFLNFKNEACVKNTRSHNLRPQHPNPAFVTIRLWALLGVVPSCVLGMVPASSGILVLFYFSCNKTKFLSFKNEACVKNTRSHNFPTRSKRPRGVSGRVA